MILYDDPSEERVCQARPNQEGGQAVRIWHVFQFKVRGLREILNDVEALYTKQYERKENDVDKLNREKQNTE